MALGTGGATKSVIWVAVERLGQQLIQALIFIILARLLTPEDFGLVAMLFIFFALAQTFIDSGMGEALIREKEISENDRSTVFWFNVVVSIIAYVLLFFAAPYIAGFYGRPELIPLTRVMGLNILFFAFSAVQRAELTHMLEFKKQALSQVPAMFIAGIISVAMAKLGFGVWAIVAQYVAFSFLGSISIWLVKPARIRFIWSQDSFKRLFGFGNKLLLSGLIGTTFEHIYKIVIGKLYPAQMLGYYDQAQRLQRLASNNLALVIQKATYPLLARSQNQGKDLKAGYSKVIQLSSILIFPIMIALFILAKPVILVLLGENWLPAVMYFRFLTVAGMFYHLNLINLNILKVKGRSDLFLRLEILKRSIVVLAVAIGVFFGIKGLLAGQIVTPILAFFINSIYTERFINYTIKEQVIDVLGALVLTLPMALVGGMLIYFLEINGPLMLIFAGTLLFLTYLASNIFIKNKGSRLALGVASPITKYFIK